MVQRAKPRQKRQSDPYKQLAKNLRGFTTVDYSKKRTLTAADKGALTKASKLLQSATFVRIAKKPRESAKAYKSRVAQIQRENGVEVSTSIRGLMAKTPHDAVDVRLRNGSVEWKLPAIRSKKQGRRERTFRVRTGYKIASARDPNYDPSKKIDGEKNPKWRPLSARVEAGIRNELIQAMKGMRRPVELSARVGQRLYSTRTVEDEDDPIFDELMDEIMVRLEFYQIRGFFQVEARST